MSYRNMPDGDFSQITSLDTGMSFWVPTEAVATLTDSARNAYCMHGRPLVRQGDDASVIDVIAKVLLRDNNNFLN